MIEVNIPGRGFYHFKYAIFDMNGTLTTDGNLSDNVKRLLIALSNNLKIYILTADTFGQAANVFKSLPVELKIVSKNNGQDDKEKFIKNLDPTKCVAFGNGFNDIKMLKNASLGIAVLGTEGLCKDTLINSDICVKSIEDGINLLLNIKRLVATMRL